MPSLVADFCSAPWPVFAPPLTFVEDGRIELDNNPVERQFKHTILLRNNVLFIGSEEGGEA